MTALQTSQVVVEILQRPTAPKLQTSQIVVEVLRTTPPPALRTSQVVAEVLTSNARYTGGWLASSSARRCVLFEIGVLSEGSETTRFLSSAEYATSPHDIPASLRYDPVVSGGLTLAEEISLTNDATLSAGDISIWNVDGARDAWLDDVFVNRRVRAWVGDVTWSPGDFRMIFDGVASGIGSSDRNTLRLKLRSKIERLNTPVSETKLGGKCTYVQVGTTVTVTKAAHGRRIGSPVEIVIKTGGSPSATYTLLTAPTPDTFTYDSTVSLTTSGEMLLEGLNGDSLVPLTFGECHNVTPLLIDGAILTYQIHAGRANSIIEVRDNGKPIPVSIDLPNGKFTLLAAPAGVVTCSVQGDAPGGAYTNNIGALIRRLVTGYGKENDRFTDEDLDLDNFAAFDLDHPQPVGLYLTDRTNVLDACQQLAASVGAQLVPTRTGLLQLQQITFPPPDYATATEIHPGDQLERSLSIASRTEVVASVKLGYCRNWTVQPDLQTNLPAAHKDMFADEWWTTTATDSVVQGVYKLDAEPVQQDTCLLTKADAIAEAARRLQASSVVRTTYRFEGTPANLLLHIGQTVKLFNHRFGLAGGKVGVVTKLAPDWSTCHVTV